MVASPHSISDFDSLTEYLRDELLWPLPLDATLDEMSFSYHGDELSLSSQAAARLKDGAISQLAPVVAGQSWGIFFVRFESEKVYVSALRDILRKLVKQSANRPSFAPEDLLFVCATREYSQFTFAHFQKRESGQPVLEFFSWARGDAHVRTLCEHNLPHLKWKDAFENDAAAWRKAWRAAFDVEQVTQKFFAAYREVFKNVESQIEGIEDKENRRLYTQRLFNRLMFLYFLQKKGWLSFDGDKNYLRALFNATQPGENFHASRLDAAFFNGLNHPSGMPQESEALRALRGDVPFLNGGLFEREGRYDEEGAVTIPNEAFEHILDLFEGWNFTVEESTPLDVQVSIDPEMLGKVFEELVTGRHETGSYYTPRGIVAFMCREALKGYLQGFENEAAVARFVDENDASHLGNPERVLAALRSVKVCDPACGSGAYLLGMMKELMRLRGALFVSHKIDAQSEYDKKLEIIGSNLYGVDADRFAANIAMLRLWLSLVIEYDGDNPPPLPNLGYKIGVGDSLLAPNPNAFNLHASEYSRLCPKLEKLHREMFALGIERRRGKKVRVKSEIERDITQIETEIRALFGDTAPRGSFDWRCDFAEVFAPREDATTPFGALNLGIELAAPATPGGFDIVLANPPYLSTKHGFGKDNKKLLAKLYRTAVGQFDAYALFLERAFNLLRQHGHYAYIVPKPILTNASMKPVRELMEQGKLVAFADPGQVFLAGVEPIVIVGAKAEVETSSVKIFHGDDISFAKPVLRLRSEWITPSRAWSVGEQPVQQWLHQLSKLPMLGDFVAITRGVECGKRDELIALHNGNGRYALLRGEDVEPFHTYFAGYFIQRGHDISAFKPLELYDAPKLLVRRVANTLIAALDDTSSHVLNTIYVLRLRASSPFSLPYLCGVLNSELLNTYFHQVFVNDDKLFPYIRKEQIEQLPIALPSQQQKSEVEMFVTEIEKTRNVQEIQGLQYGLNKTIESIYNLKVGGK